MRLSFPNRLAAFLASVGVAMVALLTMPLVVSAERAPLRLDISLGGRGNCPVVWAAYDTPINFVWRDSAGSIKTRGSDNTGDNAWVRFCPTDDSNWVTWIGDRITLSSGSYSRKFVVPNLSLRIDRVANTFFGSGPAGRTVKLEWAEGDVGVTKSIRVAPDGTWTFAPRFDLHGFDGASLSWTSVNGDFVNVGAVAPNIGVTIGKATFEGDAYPLASASASIDGGRHASGRATADYNGAFKGSFVANGVKVRVAPGDRLTATSLAPDADWIVPNIDGTASAASDTVNGRCEDTGTAAEYVRLWVIRTGGHVRGVGLWGTEPDGSFAADFSQGIPPWGGSSINIKSGDRVRVDCMQTTGDWARLLFRVP
jgi:hypothetical protein